MPFNDLLGDRKPQAKPTPTLRARVVGLEEWVEDLVAEHCRYSRAIVGYFDLGTAARFRRQAYGGHGAMLHTVVHDIDDSACQRTWPQIPWKPRRTIIRNRMPHICEVGTDRLQKT